MKRIIAILIVFIFMGLLVSDRSYCSWYYAGALTCQFYSGDWDDDDDLQDSVGRYSNEAAAGWVVPANVILCEVTAELTEAAGDISSYDYYVAGYTTSGDDLVSRISGCLSDKVDGTSWNQAEVAFTFSSTCSMSSGDAVVLFMDSDGDPDDGFDIDSGGDDYVVWRFDSTGDWASHDRYRWKTDLTNLTKSTTSDWEAKYSTMQ